MDDATFERLKTRLGALLGLDLDAYKMMQMRRRMVRHVELQAQGDVDGFIDRLGSDADQLRAFRDMLTINVTEFFRDAPQWQRLAGEVLPELLGAFGRLRIWSAGCSLGHEPYSLAIQASELGARERVRITATDFDLGALAAAQAGGPYGEADVKGVSPDLRRRYFIEGDRGWMVRPEVQRMVRFRELNLLADRYDQHLHLVVCRNVLIYFTPEVKRRVVRRCFDALAPGGVLFIGGTESLLGPELDGFDRVGGNFYRRRRVAMEATA